MGEVEHAEDTEDQGEARGDEEEEHRLGEPVQALNGEEGRVAEAAEIEHRSGGPRREVLSFHQNLR